MNRPSRLFACASVLALAACGGGNDDVPPPAPAPAPAPAGALADCGFANFQAEVIRQVNEARASARSCGTTAFAAAAPLAWHDALYRAAAGHSQDMAANGYFSHTSPDGRSPFDRMRAAGYTYRSAGENIALGQSTITAVMQAWIDSPGHCANIMSGSFREIGMACVRNSAGRPVWTMNLGSR